MSTQQDNKRIAKNTLFMYFRMLLVMGVTLYTSRVVLNVLGVDDFGIYNLVGSVIVLFSFLKAAVTTAIQRYLNFALGTNDDTYEQRIFSNSLVIFIIFITIVIVLLETIGLWFVNYKLSIPTDRIFQTNILYQLTIITFAFNIYRIPYDALIIAHEKMSFFAYVSIIEAILKLAIVFLLVVIPMDKLIVYGLLILIVTLFVNSIYIIYTRTKFPIKSILSLDRKLSKEMLSFSSWNILGGIADIGYQQGTTLILNIFYGVAFNATMGIANQVKAAIFGFVGNLLTASNPQIIKNYAAGEIDAFKNLVMKISKYAYFLILTLAIPLVLNMQYILSIWLKEIPPMSTEFCQLMVVFCTFNSLTGPLWTAAQSHGVIRNYQIVTSFILLLNVPLTYIFLYLGYAPVIMLIIQIGLVIISAIYRVYYLRSRNLMSFRQYTQNVLTPIVIVTLISGGSNYLISTYFEADLEKLLITSIISVIITFSTILLLGLNKNERQMIYRYVYVRL